MNYDSIDSSELLDHMKKEKLNYITRQDANKICEFFHEKYSHMLSSCGESVYSDDGVRWSTKHEAPKWAGLVVNIKAIEPKPPTKKEFVQALRSLEQKVEKIAKAVGVV